MKILLVNHTPIVGSGSGTFVLELATSYIEEGHEVEILCFNCKNHETRNGRIKIHNILYKNSGETVKSFPSFTGHPFSTLLYKELNSTEIKQYVDIYVKSLKKIIGSFKPDVIHTQHISLISYYSSFENVPMLVTSHGSGLNHIDYFNDALNIDIISRINMIKLRIYSISKFNYEELLGIGINKELIMLNQNGYNEEIFTYSNNEKKRSKAIKIITGGRFVGYKKIDFALKVFEKLCNVESSYTFYLDLFGDGPCRMYIEQLINDLNLKNLSYHGFISQKQLAYLFHSNDLALFTATGEPFGLVIAEALACGLPVIAVKSGAYCELVNKSNGVLIEEYNIDDWVNEILTYLNELHLVSRKKISVDSKYLSSKDTKKKYLSAYEELIHEKRENNCS